MNRLDAVTKGDDDPREKSSKAMRMIIGKRSFHLATLGSAPLRRNGIAVSEGGKKRAIGRCEERENEQQLVADRRS